jgi:hypothetical protein
VFDRANSACCGPETVVPGVSGSRRGPLVNIAGDMVVQDATGMDLIAHRLSFGIVSAGLGS